ncbi:hypothetical protein [Acinetobacter modestus]|uniref:hypothetical protein n=1 Tax=Acinetobacter modestus TaxID=1776740 RepID=UPI001F4B2FFE|nr:hypothetical protein [Acinetobacter modestus]MCH7328967.1 hypothetical protein [Acinetobacter modestus]
MPNTNNLVSASSTTFRSNSPATFFDKPKDATPQDCKEVAQTLVDQARSVLAVINKQDPDTDWLFIQIGLIQNLLSQASAAMYMLDLDQVVLMTQREEA